MSDLSQATRDLISAALRKVSGDPHLACFDPRASLAEDLGIDSLLLAELVETLEHGLQLAIPDEETGRLRTLGDIESLIIRLSTESKRGSE